MILTRNIAALLAWVALSISSAGCLPAQPAARTDAAYSPEQCPSCASWNAPQPPSRLFANVHYVGTRGLSAILLTSNEGHILIDAGLPESAAPIMASIRASGFRVEDIRLIVTSHAHYDHSGGVAIIQRASGAHVAASPSSARALALGDVERDDPQFGIHLAYPAVTGTRVEVFDDGDTLRVGSLAITAHLTPGHTPGGTSWSWRACEGSECLDFVYADSQTPVSADNFYFTRSSTYPNAVGDFERGLATLSRLPCDVLLTPHPGASELWERLEAGKLRDPSGCSRYVASARRQLETRIARERSTRGDAR